MTDGMPGMDPMMGGMPGGDPYGMAGMAGGMPGMRSDDGWHAGVSGDPYGMAGMAGGMPGMDPMMGGMPGGDPFAGVVCLAWRSMDGRHAWWYPWLWVVCPVVIHLLWVVCLEAIHLHGWHARG